MPLNKLDNFIKNTEGRILYVNPNDLDATDSLTNQGNSLTQPFKTIQRALIEAARFSYVVGTNNDITEKTTILLFPGVHVIDNRPGYGIENVGGTAYAVAPSGAQSYASSVFPLTLTSNFDLTQSDNILYKYNSINGGVVVPRGTSIVGLDLRKTKIKPLYVPNPTDITTPKSAIFRITGACYFWQFSLFDADPSGLVYTNQSDFSSNNQATPTFSHHKLTCFEYADGVNVPTGYSITDLDMYYAKLSNAFTNASGRAITEVYPASTLGFAKQRPEWEIVGAFSTDPINIASIQSGDGFTPTSIITVNTTTPHNLQTGTPIKVNGVLTTDYNISTTVQNVTSTTQFTYLLPYVRPNLPASPALSTATVTIETDTVSGASPYIFNCSLRSIWGMNGMHADGSKASGFRSMVVAQFTGVSLQKDDRAFVQYNETSRNYQGINYTAVTGSLLTSGSSSTDPNSVYHLNPDAIYRDGWDNTHIKVSNDAFIQVVSVFAIGYTKHFEGLSGADISITNSNSNFGENSLTANGFKKAAFTKDDYAYVTSIVAPRAVVNNSVNSTTPNEISWVQFDVGLTTSVGISSHLYLYGYNSLDIPPANVIEGYRIGANYTDKIYTVSQVDGVTVNSANIYMVDNADPLNLNNSLPIGAGNTFATGITTSQKTYSATGPDANFRLTIGSHGLKTGESIRIISNVADLPENIVENTLYYAIDNGDNNTIKVATSPTNASIGVAVSMYGGSSLVVQSRVSDKDPGDIGSPIQWDPEPSGNTALANWFIHVNQNNPIYNEFASAGISSLGNSSNISYINRTTDTRSNDEKLYKVRVVIPKESVGARDPVEGYVIQSSSTTNVRTNSDFTLTSINSTDYGYNRNPRFIATCSVSSNTVTVVTELPHNLNVNDIVNILSVTDTNNTTGIGNSGYNGTFSVNGVLNDKTFTYPVIDTSGNTHVPGTFTNNVNVRTATLPRFQRNDLQSNYYIYKNEIVQPYVYNAQDGIYHLYVLNASNPVPVQFTNLNFGQNIVNLYPQQDKDNISEDPRATFSAANRFPIGQVSTNDVEKSITRETVDQFLKDFNVGIGISSVIFSGGISTITFTRSHGLAGLVTYTTLTGGSGHSNGTFYNVKLYNNSSLTSTNGATAQISVVGGTVNYAQIMAPGAAYTSGQTLYFDTGVIGGSTDATMSITTAGIATALGNTIQITGDSTLSSGYYRIRSIPSTNSISIAQTSGDPSISSSQFVFLTGPSIPISSSQYNSTTGITTFTFNLYHGLQSGNRFRVIDGNNNNLGDFLVNSVNSSTPAFTFYSGTQLSSPTFILKHGLSANNGISDSTGETIGTRDTSFFANDELLVLGFTDDNHIQVTTSKNGFPTAGIATATRFPLGSYIQLDNEIMRITSSTLGGAANNEITVIRGTLGTRKQTHNLGQGLLIKKINPLPVEFRRPSILRASNQTFEYLGYGPGNYSTALPQLQINNLTDVQTYLAQSQQRSCGTVVYSGMNNNGDFYIGNKKISSKTGNEVIFDAPIVTTRGEATSQSNISFDELTVTQRLIVEGGSSSNLLSQFNGPLTVNNTFTSNFTSNFNGITNVLNKTDSTSTKTGALIVSGGVGIGKNLNVGGNTTLTGILTINGGSGGTALQLNNGGDLVFFNAANTGSATVYCNNNNELRTNGSLYVGTALSVTGATILSSTLNVSSNSTVGGALIVTGATTLNSVLNVSTNATVGGALTVTGATTLSSSLNITSNTASTSATTGALVVTGGVGIGGYLYVAGDITAFSTSDQRLKDNIKPIPDALNKVLSISGNTFDWIEGSGKEGSDVGIIAQEILEVLPEAVTTRETGYLAVRYEKIIPLLIEAIKDLKAEINELKRG